jgi:hypothetical protein
MSLAAEVVLTWAIWLSLGLYALAVGFWLFEVLVLRLLTDEPAIEYGPDDVQVRVLTIDAEAVVQGTVAALPEAIADVRVIAEAPMDVPGATVHVVPEEFSCAASYKGRALEWARQHVPCEQEYVLYLDEDTILSNFEGVPDRDVIQFTEKPIYTGSRLAYWVEVFRVGYQFEQFAFPKLRFPLYAWGGGIAIRRDLEDRVTWDASTVTEDTSFIWRAAGTAACSFAVVNARFRNQSPPSLRALVHQRRRWLSGTLSDMPELPWSYKLLANTRTVAWAFSPLVPVLVAVSWGLDVFSGPVYTAASLGMLSLLFVYTVLGLYVYRKHPVVALGLFLATPLLVFVHALGALWGIVRPVSGFVPTEKVTPDELEAVHPDLEAGDIEDHSGREEFDIADD